MVNFELLRSCIRVAFGLLHGRVCVAAWLHLCCCAIVQVVALYVELLGLYVRLLNLCGFAELYVRAAGHLRPFWAVVLLHFGRVCVSALTMLCTGL